MADEPDLLSNQHPHKILLAQYDNQERNFTRLFLEIVGGYHVLEAANGVGLIKQLKNRPDLLLIDTVAQGGFLRALEIIRRTKAMQSVPVAIYSHEQHRMPECIRKGADGFIIKPTPPGMLLGKIWKLLGDDSQRAATAVGFAAKYKKDIQNIDNLPTLPTVYTEVDNLCKNPDVGADELSKVIETDPSISLKLLNLANSAFFGFSRQIKSVRDAISLLGNQTVRNTILNISVYEATKNLKDTAGFDKKAFWIHSAGVGSIARFLSTKLKLDRPEGFTAGIIHDMGKLIMDALYTDFYAEVIQTVQRDRISIREAEEDVIGLNHAQIGRELCESWHLPAELVEAVASHHHPARSETDSEIASLIHISDVFARKLNIGSGGDDTVPQIHPGALNRLNVKEDTFENWVPEMQETIDRDKALLSVLQR